MAAPTPNNDPASPPHGNSSTPNPRQNVQDVDEVGAQQSYIRSNSAMERLVAWSAANRNRPSHHEESGRPGSATSGDSPETRRSAGPIRVLSKDGELTELGKRVEQERLAKSEAAATATGTSEDGEKERPEGESSL